MKGVLLVGATGSIGQSALHVIAALPSQLRLVGVFAGRSAKPLAEIARKFGVRYAGLAHECSLPDCGSARTGFGDAFLAEAIADPAVDIVLNAATGAAGLPASIAAVERGLPLALANKESMVMAGPLLTARAAETGATILPVDSEHSAIHQCLRAGREREVRKVILTASGGPFHKATVEQMRRATPEQALAHPTWSMGPKVTIDSATLVNKALEIIEARWMFDLAPEALGSVIHPQSIVHSFVEFVDGAVIAQLGAPDMRLPIQYALTWPDRAANAFESFDPTRWGELTFEQPDRVRFPALDLADDVLRLGGTAGATVNAANEVAVTRFLQGEIPFPAIVDTVAEVLANAEIRPATTLDAILAADHAAREEATTCRN